MSDPRNNQPYSYTPYTSELLDTGMAVVNDITAFTGLDSAIPTLPTGKQVIFFSLGIICVVMSLAIMSRSLVLDSVPGLSTIAKIAS